MKTRKIATVLIFLLLCCAIFAQDRHEELTKLAEKVDKHYNNLKSMRAQFTETYSGAGTSRSEAGTLWLKQPGKMRWEYGEPRKKLFISDGKTAWFYVPGEQQARKAPVSKIDDIRSPLRFLLGKTKLMKEFRDLAFVPKLKPGNSGDLVIRGLPTGMEDRVSSVLLEVNAEGRIDRILIEEIDGATTDFRFSDEIENLQVADSVFKFQAPNGVEVVEATELGD
jgi:outer membrane lipoprotein carrier protein